MRMSMICGQSVERFLEEIKGFHGFIAPGIVVGGFIVDWARELIGTDSAIRKSLIPFPRIGLGDNSLHKLLT